MVMSYEKTVRHCRRCGEKFRSYVSEVCDDCWEQLGQMSFEIEEEDADEAR